MLGAMAGEGALPEGSYPPYPDHVPGWWLWWNEFWANWKVLKGVLASRLCVFLLLYKTQKLSMSYTHILSPSLPSLFLFSLWLPWPHWRLWLLEHLVLQSVSVFTHTSNSVQRSPFYIYFSSPTYCLLAPFKFQLNYPLCVKFLSCSLGDSETSLGQLQSFVNSKWGSYFISVMHMAHVCIHTHL